MERDELLEAFRAFEAEGLEYVLIGAAAMGFHGVVRATEDVDLLIQATPANVERLRRALQRVYPADANIEEIRTEDLLGDYPAVRYYPPAGTLYFDLLTRLGEAASYETVEAQWIAWEGTRVRVATPAALYRLKGIPCAPWTGGLPPRSVSGSASRTNSMPVQRFRSVEEMDAAPILVSAEEGFDRFLRHCARYRRIARRTYRPGVLRFRSLEEAQRAREAASASAARGSSD